MDVTVARRAHRGLGPANRARLADFRADVRAGIPQPEESEALNLPTGRKAPVVDLSAPPSPAPAPDCLPGQ